MSDTAEFRATDALKSARDAANSDEVLRAPKLAELEASAFKGGTLEEQVQAATDELRKRRRETFEQGVPARDVYDVPIIERTVSPETRRALESDTKETGLRRATRDISDQRLVEKYEPWIGKGLASPDEIAR